MDVLTHRRSHRARLIGTRTPTEYFQGDSSLVACWNLLPGYGLMDSVGGNHLIAADVLNGRGNFTTNADSYWTLATAGTTIAGGVLDFNVASQGACYKDTVCVSGKTYEVIYVLSRTSGAAQCVLGGTQGTVNNLSGTYTERIVCGATAGRARMNTVGAAVLTVDNLIIREVYDGNIGPDGALFNGVSNCLQTTNPIDLTGTNKVTLLFSLKPVVYNLTGNSILFELSSNNNVNAGTFVIQQRGDVANDPIRALTSQGDFVNWNGGDYFNAPNRWSQPLVKDFALVMDKGLSNDIRLYSNGNIANQDTSFSGIVTGNFGNFPLYIGSKSGTSLFSNISLSRVALYKNTLSGETIADYNAWKNDTRNPHFFSLFFASGGSNVHKIRR